MPKTVEAVSNHVEITNDGDSKLQKATEVSDSTQLASQDKVTQETSSESVVSVASKVTKGEDHYLDHSGQGTQLFEGRAKNSALEYQDRVLSGSISSK